ncbi:MAG: sigma-70 family RNA polymerase sigma factor, partial [Oscillospiraceae bacterium]|nr:sigma-70 family RNA polymerase sigma factor [Oscillospiraceae bacterium]
WRKRTQALTADLPFTDEESQRDVWAAVLSLQDNFKSAVLLYYYMGYSVAELAKICGVSEPAAKKRLERARKKLKEILGDDYNDL